MKCDVCIPVGPNHEAIHNQAVESVRIATLDKGPFSTINIQIVDDTDGVLGRGKARNQAIDNSSADWLFFLDADDRMHPKAFSVMSNSTDLEAVWGNIMELSNGVGVWRYQVPEIWNYKELVSFDPYLTLQMGHFVRRESVIRFDEEMTCGEDWKYYLEMWKTRHCRKIQECLFLNQRGQHSTGPKSATGVEWSSVVNRLMEEARGNKTTVRDGYHFPNTDTHFSQATMELEHIQPCIELCKTTRTAIDCGAHVGGWTKALSSYFDKVYSFEASKENYECFLLNTKECLNIKSHNVGVGDKPGRGSLHEPTNPGNSGAAWIVNGNDFEVVTLDSQNLIDIDFIKIDVEGYEPMVLEGAENLIKRDKPVILIEQKPITARYGLGYLKAGEILESWGYVLVTQVNKDYIYRHKDAE